MNPGEGVGLTHLVLAYSVVFAAIFVYLLSMGSRQKKLEKRLRQVQEEIKDRMK
jgi:CcmD family protein